MLATMAKYCPCLESFQGLLGNCTEDAVLALLALPRLFVAIMSTFDLEIPELDQPEVKATEEENEKANSESDEFEFKPPPIVHSSVQFLTWGGDFGQRLLDRLRCSHLRVLSLRPDSDQALSVPRFDTLLDSAAGSLASLEYIGPSNPHDHSHVDTSNFASSSFDWSRFTSLKRVPILSQTSVEDVIALVRGAPSLESLTAFLRSPIEMVRVFNAARNNSTLRFLVIGPDEVAAWPPGSLDFILPTLLHPDRRPPALTRLTIPPDSLSNTLRSKFRFSGPGPSDSIDVKAYHPT